MSSRSLIIIPFMVLTSSFVRNLSLFEDFRAFKAKVELQQWKKIKVVHSDKGGEYYGRYNETGHNPKPFAKYL